MEVYKLEKFEEEDTVFVDMGFPEEAGLQQGEQLQE